MKNISQTKQFLKDVKKATKRGKDLKKLQDIVRLLAHGKPLPLKHRDHSLIGEWHSSRDCHIEPDWVLIYFADKDTLVLQRTGTHADLFK